jgi:uncharacterized protein involved in response to NO
LVVPLVLGFTPPKDVTKKSLPWMAILFAFGLLIIASIVVEHAFSHPSMMTLRGVLLLALLVFEGRLYRTPRLPGLQRRVVQGAAWLVPLGSIAAGIWTDYRVALLHITFVGGFSLLTLAIGSHVVLSHTDREALRDRAKVPVAIYAFLILLASATRASADLMLEGYFHHLAYASAVWIAATLGWLYLLLAPQRAARDASTHGSRTGR